MRNSKLYSILESFDKYEQNRCRKYLTSPYFNKDENLLKLYDYFIKDINKSILNGSSHRKEVEKETVWKAIIKNKAYDDVRFRKYLSDLLKLVEGYLSQQVFENNPLYKATYLIEAVGRRKMDKLYNSTMKTARRITDQQRYRPANFYFYQYQIEKNYYDLTEFETKRSDRTNIEEIGNNLDAFYLAEKLRIYCAVLTQQRFVSHEYHLLFMEEIIQHLKEIDYETIPPIALYYQIYLTIVEADNVGHYFKLKELLDKYGLHFPPEEAKDVLYMSAQNYCIRKINQGNQMFLEELFLLYKDLIEKEIIFAEGELSPWYYKNIVIVALRLGKYNWTEKFIQEHSDKLPFSFRENAVTFNLARLYWYQKQHDKVIELLREVEYEDVSYNLESKAMLLATYYETDEIEPLYSLLESFRAFLNRHSSIPIQRIKYYKNLIKFTKKLTKIIHGDQKSIERLKKEIQETEGFNDRWLKEKIAELE